MSVFCEERESMELQSNEESLRDNAVSLLYTCNTSFYPCCRAKSVQRQCLEHSFCIAKPDRVYYTQNKLRENFYNVSLINYISI